MYPNIPQDMSNFLLLLSFWNIGFLFISLHIYIPAVVTSPIVTSFDSTGWFALLQLEAELTLCWWAWAQPLLILSLPKLSLGTPYCTYIDPGLTLYVPWLTLCCSWKGSPSVCRAWTQPLLGRGSPFVKHGAHLGLSLLSPYIRLLCLSSPKVKPVLASGWAWAHPMFNLYSPLVSLSSPQIQHGITLSWAWDHPLKVL